MAASARARNKLIVCAAACGEQRGVGGWQFQRVESQGCCHLSLSEVLVFTSLLTPLFGLLGLGLHLGHLCGAQAKAQ